MSLSFESETVDDVLGLYNLIFQEGKNLEDVIPSYVMLENIYTLAKEIKSIKEMLTVHQEILDLHSDELFESD